MFLQDADVHYLLQIKAESSLRAKFYPTQMEDLWVIVRVPRQTKRFVGM